MTPSGERLLLWLVAVFVVFVWWGWRWHDMALQEALTTREGATFTALVVGSALKYLWMSKVRVAREKLFQLVGHVAELCVYPMKGCRAVQLQSAKATITGLTSGGFHDRWWMMENMAGTPVAMKTEPRLTLVSFTIDGDWLVVSAPDMTPLRLPVHPDPASYPIKSLKIYGIEMNVLECGPEANDWFSRYIGQTVLVYHSRPGIGTHDTYEHPLGWDTDARKGDRTVFAYLTAYLLTTTASLSELNHRLDSPVSSRHFRPNIVVQNSRPFDEDNWEEIRIGNNAKFHYVQPCRRCMITTIDPDTAVRSPTNQPLATLKKYRQREPYGVAPLFGAHISTDCCGPVSVGDPVFAIMRQPATA